MRKQIHDLEPKLSYNRLSKRQLKKRFTVLFFLIIVGILIALLAHMALADAQCVEMQRSINVSYSCEHGNRCCEPLPVHNPNAPWVN